MPPSSSADFLSLPAVARELHVRVTRVRKWVADGVLVAMPPSIFGHYPRVSRASLDEFQRLGLPPKPPTEGK